MRLVWVVIPLVLIGIIGMSESFAEENSSIIYEKDLEFSVMTDKKHYHDDEIIHIFWHVKNVGNSDISYTTSSTCNDGFSWSITNSEIHRVNGVLGESANLIKEDDLTVLKFENPGFYGDVLQFIKDEPNKTRDILIFTSNGEKLVDILKEKFEVVKHSEPKSEPDAIGARVSVKYIPEIANMELVTSILEGDAPVCGSAELTKILEPNEIIDGNFSWSQLVHVKDNFPQHVPDGNYSILVNFYRISNCIVIGINSDNSQLKKIPCFGGIPSNMSEEQYIEYVKQQLKTIEHPELRAELIKELEILSTGSEYEYSQSEDAASILSDAENQTKSYTLEEALEIQRQRTGTPESNPAIEPKIPNYPIELTAEQYQEIKKIGEVMNSSPLKQFRVFEIESYNVNCKAGLDLIFKSSDNSPACVTSSTAEKLIQRGWASP